MEGRNRRFSPDSEWIASQQALRDELPDNFDQGDIKKRMAEVSYHMCIMLLGHSIGFAH